MSGAKALTELDSELLLHFQEHVPNIHPVYLETAKAAIAEIDAYRPNTQILLPKSGVKTAMEIATSFHLDSFCKTASDDLYAERIEGTGAGKTIDRSGDRPAGTK